MPVLRAVVLFLLGIGFACGAYYSGAMNWVGDRWTNYWTTPVAVVPTPGGEVPVPTAVASYPGAPPPAVGPDAPAPYSAAPPVAPVGPAPAAPGDAPPPDAYGAPPPNDYAGPDTPEPAYAPEGGPPVDIVPVDRVGPPLSLHISIGDRGAGSVDCVPAYTVINDTHRPILLTQRARYRGYGRGPRDKVIVRPGERQIACAADVYASRDDGPRFDYYRRNVWYGPDAIDLPPPVNIRVTD
jgi:hypothetical protein